ncbi:MAG: gliding motility lipoprotein GldD [Salibacteraceae bacterium]
MLRTVFTLAILASILSACDREYTPKPKAYARINLPTPSYIMPDTASWSCPYLFEASRYSYLTIDKRYQNEYCWFNIYYPSLNATIHLTYSTLDDNLGKQIEDTRKLAMKHVGKATAINERRIENDSAKVYGLTYEFKGETASDMQFFLTDSSKHFLRGALYFNVRPNKDSLDPVIDYVKSDIHHFIETLRWTTP